ncbi:MAG TPA: M81 family metallopeptidase [Thermomicrobiales bacterium]|nr:M81 family metallopeptidase [Thermomicrobiales bacterium]
MPVDTTYRIGIGGIAIESSTFSSLVSTKSDFTIQRGDEITASYPYFENGTFEGRRDVEWFPTFKARSIPGGPVDAATYQRFKTELLDRLRASLPLDGFFFDIHGAMSVVGMDDAEGDLVAAIRETAGPGCVISAGMDLHGNVSDDLVRAVDVFTAYREAPHIDAMESKARAVRLLLRSLDEGIRPFRAWARIPVILPGERTSTFREPGKTVYARLAESDAVPGVVDASLWVGYVWADQPRASATTVVTGTDPAAIRDEAEKIARRYWDARHEFDFDRPSGTADWTIAEALRANRKSVIISDSGDNPTAGGAGDIPYFAERLLANPVLASGERTAIVAAIPSPGAATIAKAAGRGASVSVMIGGVLDPVNGSPLDLTGTVHAVHENDPVGNDIVVIRSGGVHVIIPSRRKPYHRIQEFRNVDLDPAEHDIMVVKIGYLEPELREAASLSFIALTPGAVNQDIPSLPFHRVVRPVFPLDPDMPDPRFDVRLFDPIG